MAENAAIKDLKDDVAALRSAVKDLTKDLKGVGGGAAMGAKGRVESVAAGLRSGLDEAARAAKETGRQSAEAVGGKVAEHPWQSVMIAFGAGLVIAQMLKRR